MYKNVLAKPERRALISGITGQDGSYLAEFLLDRGYEVHGIVRRSSSPNISRISHLYSESDDFESQITLHYGDITDGGSLTRLLRDIQPHEVYNLAAQSHVRTSFDIPEYTADVTAIGALRLLEAIRDSGSEARFYQASSSEMFGKAAPAQSETTPFAPCSPYAVSKLFAYWSTVNYRDSYGIFAANGILFNHESPRRGENFVTRKVTQAVARILAGKERYLYLGNLDARRDWGYAPEFVEAMWLMLQQSEPDDYVIATGESHSVRELAQEAFGLAGLNWQDYVRYDERYVRPSEVCHLLGDPSKAQKELGWQARTSFRELVRIMLETDLIAELGGDAAARHLSHSAVLAS